MYTDYCLLFHEASVFFLLIIVTVVVTIHQISGNLAVHKYNDPTKQTVRLEPAGFVSIMIAIQHIYLHGYSFENNGTKTNQWILDEKKKALFKILQKESLAQCSNFQIEVCTHIYTYVLEGGCPIPCSEIPCHSDSYVSFPITFSGIFHWAGVYQWFPGNPSMKHELQENRKNKKYEGKKT